MPTVCDVYAEKKWREEGTMKEEAIRLERKSRKFNKGGHMNLSLKNE